MIDIYSDASVAVKHKLATATCFIISPNMFIGYNIFTYPKVDTSTLAEIRGAADGIEYASNLADLTNEEVTLYSDFPALLSVAKCNLSTTEREQMLLYKEDVERLQNLVKRYHVTIQRIQGHQKQTNPNRIVDFMSNSALRYKVRGV